MTTHLALIVGASLVFAVGAAAAIGKELDCRESRAKDAQDTWRSIALRNGVTAPSPWHGPTSPMNAPGLVEVHPVSRRRPEPSLGPSVVSVLPESDAAPLVPAVEPLVDELEAPVLELGEELTPEETAMVGRCIRDGMGKYKTIEKVWAIKKGGSKRFKAALARYEEIKAEVTANVE